MNLQNLKDDIYAYRDTILHRSGFFLLPVGLLLLAVPTMMRDYVPYAPDLFAIIVVIGVVSVAFGITFVSHPAMASQEVYYRYYVDVKTDTEKLKGFLSGVRNWSSRIYPDPLKHNQPFIETRIFVTRLEDRILLRMKF